MSISVQTLPGLAADPLVYEAMRIVSERAVGDDFQLETVAPLLVTGVIPGGARVESLVGGTLVYRDSKVKIGIQIPIPPQYLGTGTPSVSTFLRGDGTWAATSAASPLTTKGDVWGFSTVDDRIPIGANGYVLTADSAQTLGLKWAAVTGTGTVTSLTPSTGITLTPNPISTTGTIGVTVPVVVTIGGTGTTTAFTPGSIVFAGASGIYSQNNSQLFYDNANNRLGLLTTSPNAPLDVRGKMRGGDNSHNDYPADSPAFYFSTAISNVIGNWTATNAGGNGAQFTMRSDGTGAAGAMATGNWLGLIGFRGKDDVGFASTSTALLIAAASENWLSTARGTELQFQTTPNGTTTPATVATLDQHGYLGIGVAAPAAKLHVKSGSSGATILYGPEFVVESAGNALQKILNPSGSTGYLAFGNEVNDQDAMIFFSRTDRKLKFSANAGSSPMALDSTGNVGIGTTGPEARLHVKGAAGNSQGDQIKFISQNDTAPGYLGTTFNNVYLTSNGYYNGTSFVAINGSFPIGAVTIGTFATESTVGLATSNAAGGAPATRLFVRGDGKIGVGKTSPVGTFDVAGQSSSDTSLLVTSTGIQNVICPEAFGAKHDAQFNYGGMTSGSATLTLNANLFVAGDVGKTICVVGAGASKAVLKTTISGYTSGTVVTLAATASTSVYLAQVVWGTDSTSAFNSMFGTQNSTGGTLYQLQPGGYLITDELTVSAASATVCGAGKFSSIIYFLPTGSSKACFKVTTAVAQITDMSLLGPMAKTPSYGVNFTANTEYGTSVERVRIDGMDVGIRYPSGVAGGDTLIRDIHIYRSGTYGIAQLGTTGVGLRLNDGLIWQKAFYATVTVSNGSTTITTGSATFYQDLIGMRIAISGAGSAGADLITTITDVASGTSATIGAAASTNASKTALIGADSQAGIYMQSGGMYATDVDCVGGMNPIWFDVPNGGTVANIFLTQMSGDTANGDGSLAITVASGGFFGSLQATNCWFSSANSGGVGYDPAKKQCGIYVSGNSNTTCRNLYFVGCRVLNNNKQGAYFTNATGVRLVGCEFDGNSRITSGTYAAVHFATGVSCATFMNGFVCHVNNGAGSTDSYSVQIDSGVTTLLNVSGNMFRDFQTAATPILNNSGLGGTSVNIGQNVY